MKQNRRIVAAVGSLLLGLCLLCLALPIIGKHRAQTEDEAFSAFTRELFRQEISSNSLNLHYTLANPEAYGLEPLPASFGTYSPEALAGSAASLENIKKTLSSFSRMKLSPDNRLTYDILLYQINQELKAAPYAYYEEIFSPTLGVQAQLPILLAEYAFRKPEDIDAYLSLLSQLDTYYESLMEYQRERARRGLFMTDETADAVIAQCKSFLSSPSEHFLLSGFRERLENVNFLSDTEKETYCLTNRSLVFGHVFPAYENLIEGLTALKGQGRNELGLCYLEQGIPYYEAKTACQVGTNRSMAEIRDLIDAQIKADLRAMAELLTRNPKLAGSPAELPLENDPVHILQTLEEKIKDDFPAVKPVSCQVKYVTPSLERYLSPAFYLTPPLDCMEEHVIYINPAAKYDNLSLFTTLAHEGYPGHLYQTVYENSRNLDPVRSLFSFGGYVEGWATYIEEASYFYTDLDADMAALLSLNGSISLGLHARADVGIHFEGWDENALADYLLNFGIRDSAAIHSIFQAILQDPGNYLKYYFGALEFKKLKEQASAALSRKFVLKDFHEFLLSMGPAPFPVLEAYLAEWIREQEKQAGLTSAPPI